MKIEPRQAPVACMIPLLHMKGVHIRVWHDSRSRQPACLEGLRKSLENVFERHIKWWIRPVPKEGILKAFLQDVANIKPTECFIGFMLESRHSMSLVHYPPIPCFPRITTTFCCLKVYLFVHQLH